MASGPAQPVPPPGVNLDFAAQQGRLVVGMSQDQVRRAWGDPTRTSRRVLERGLHEEWHWIDNTTRQREVVFSNGVVASFTDR